VTDPARGLEAAVVRERRARLGTNEIAPARTSPAFALLARQLRGPMNALLAGAAVLSAVMGDRAEAWAIGAVVAINTAIGFVQEYRAEKALAALRALSAPRARVRREGRVAVVDARDVVPGDILLLEPGDVVAADGRLLEAHQLLVMEAALTGESAAVEKSDRPAAADAPLAERTDRVFLGTSVAAGRAVAEVTSTGMATEMGHIAGLLAATPETPTPLQRQLDELGRMLLRLCLVAVAGIAAAGVARGIPPLELLLSMVSLAVAAVPEGLPAVVTIALALGVQRMATRNALVRRLAAVETLGSATVICTDKTGTLTTGRMEVREVWARDPHAALFAGAACSDAELDPAGGGAGDPTEIAILAAAAARGIHRADIERSLPRTAESPFDSARRRMSVLRADGTLYVKGAPDAVLPRCREGATGAAEAAADMAGRALRVLAVAVGGGPREEDLRLLGLLGLSDPPRPEAVDAIARAHRAGVRTVMITGDHLATARAIARELGLRADELDVHARATAEDKLRIVREMKARGEVVAMTGDGVNDAPALREAHIGVAMGRSGTEVTREAADVVLTDDNYATIVAAIEEGRGIYDNIRKTLVYLLTGSASELWVMLSAAALGLPLPLLPLHLLWVNVVTDSMPAAALVMDPADADAMRRPPRPPRERMLAAAHWRRIALVGVLEGTVVLAAFRQGLAGGDVALARTMAFSTLVFCELFRAFATRSFRRVYWQVGVSSNLVLAAVVAFSAAVQVGLPALPALRALFDLRELDALRTGMCVALGLVPVSALELAKMLPRGPASRFRGAAAGGGG
jgi:Ca2+-transporting ATPase